MCLYNWDDAEKKVAYALPFTVTETDESQIPVNDNGGRLFVQHQLRLQQSGVGNGCITKRTVFIILGLIILTANISIVTISAVSSWGLVSTSRPVSSIAKGDDNDDDYFNSIQAMATAEYVWYFNNDSTGRRLPTSKRYNDRISLRIEDGIAFIQIKVYQRIKTTTKVYTYRQQPPAKSSTVSVTIAEFDLLCVLFCLLYTSDAADD